MRKADKRRRGEERAAYYIKEEKERGLAAQKLDHKLRAKKQARILEENKKKTRRKTTKRALMAMAGHPIDDTMDTASMEMECI